MTVSKIYIVSFILLIMKIEDELYLIDKNTVPAGFSVSSRSIRDRNVRDLIGILNRNRIKINLADSEQDIIYRVLGIEKRSTVPLQTSFEGSVAVVGYNLRNLSLEIGLRDYHERSGGNGRLGGTVHREDGILCSFKFEGTYEEGNKLETAKKVLKEFYR